jgi:hypothetical protein
VETLPGTRGQAIDADGRALRIVPLLFFYLGIALTLHQWATIQLPLISVSLAVALCLGWHGWREIEWTSGFRAYYVFAVVFSVLAMFSSVAVWDLSAVYWSATNCAWVLLIIPGLAVLLADKRNRLALVLGLGVGMAVYGLARALSFGGGTGVIGTPAPVAYFFGVNRNDIDSLAIFVFPLLLAPLGRRWRRVRWALSALAVLWLFLSGGRIFFLALPVMALAYAVVQPRLGRTLKAAVAVLLLGMSLLIAMRAFSGEASIGPQRFLASLSGQRDEADVLRGILIRRAWDLGVAHPVLGVGYGREYGASDPAIGEIRRDRQLSVQNAGVHNVYLWMFASLGPPAAASFALMLVVALICGFARRRDPDARWVTVSLVGAVVAMGFYMQFDFVLYALALMLGVTGRPDGDRHPELLKPALARR